MEPTNVVATGKWIKCKVTGTGCFVAGTKVWVSATADNTSAVGLKRISSLISSHEEQTEFVQTALMQPIIEKQSIESVAIGSRVTGENPRPWEYDDEFSEPDASTWSLARFSLQKEDGSWIDVEMIRPSWYWEQQGAIPGSYVFIEFPELEASGLALVHAIEPCPVIASGTGRVVTARILTRQVSQLVELTLEDGSTLVGTPQHPIWSVERQDWVELGELVAGEHLRTEVGPVEILTTQPLTSGESVYNLEIHRHHVYQVAELGVLVHNSNLDNYRAPSKTAAERATEIHQALSKGTQGRTTTAVTETAEGVRVVSSSELRLRPAQRRALQPGEVEGVGPGHAEVTGVNAANGMGLTPTGTAASRPICPSCANTLQQQGVQPLSPLKKRK